MNSSADVAVSLPEAIMAALSLLLMGMLGEWALPTSLGWGQEVEEGEWHPTVPGEQEGWYPPLWGEACCMFCGGLSGIWSVGGCDVVCCCCSAPRETVTALEGGVKPV